MVIEMPTPQLRAAAPDVYCAKCGRKMQHIGTTESTHHYVCYSHSNQNAGTIEPYYYNLHYKSVDEHGRIREKR